MLMSGMGGDLWLMWSEDLERVGGEYKNKEDHKY